MVGWLNFSSPFFPITLHRNSMWWIFFRFEFMYMWVDGWNEHSTEQHSSNVYRCIFSLFKLGYSCSLFLFFFCPIHVGNFVALIENINAVYFREYVSIFALMQSYLNILRNYIYFDLFFVNSMKIRLKFFLNLHLMVW